VDVHLKGGDIIKGVDEIWVGTGYEPRVPWLYVRDPRVPPASSASVSDKDDNDAKGRPLMNIMQTSFDSTTPGSTPNPHRIPHLHRLILYSPNPTLAFVGSSVVCYTPFAVGDLMSTWVAGAWNPDSKSKGWYPHTPVEMLVSERERLEEVERMRKELLSSKQQPPNATSSENSSPVTDSDISTPSPATAAVDTDGDSPDLQVEASALWTYNVFGPTELPYCAALRKDVVEMFGGKDWGFMEWDDKPDATTTTTTTASSETATASTANGSVVDSADAVVANGDIGPNGYTYPAHATYTLPDFDWSKMGYLQRREAQWDVKKRALKWMREQREKVGLDWADIARDV
jgi:hypothetical protein